MTATFLPPLFFSYILLLWEVVRGGVGGGLSLFVVVTPLNLICNGDLLVEVLTIANGENKSAFAVFIIWLTFILS